MPTPALAVTAAYESVERRGFRPRLVRTSLPADTLRALFRATVAGDGWSIVDEGNPVVAQSGPNTGVRQQIALHVDPGARGSEARIAVVRYSRRSLRGIAKAHVLRVRMKAFLTAVRDADRSASIAG